MHSDVCESRNDANNVVACVCVAVEYERTKRVSAVRR